MQCGEEEKEEGKYESRVVTRRERLGYSCQGGDDKIETGLRMYAAKINEELAHLPLRLFEIIIIRRSRVV